MIDSKQFKDSLLTGKLPLDLPVHLKALWYDGRGDWKRAHDLIDQLTDQTSAHVHAYLHRKEGDLWNADYWYKRAGKQRPEISLENEWDQMVLLFTTK
jgi:hypothetical protein